jgi:hypothetical protein
MRGKDLYSRCEDFVNGLNFSDDFEILKSKKSIEKIVLDSMKEGKEPLFESLRLAENSIKGNPTVELPNGSSVFLKDLLVFGIPVTRILFMIKIQLELEGNKKLAKKSEYYAKIILDQLDKFMKKVVDKNIEKEGDKEDEA